MLLYLVKLFHIIFVSVWFSAGFFISKDIKRTLEKGSPHTEVLAERVASVERVSMPCGILTLITGLGLIFLNGGFASVPVQIHISLLLTIVLFVTGPVGVFGTWRKIQSIIQDNGDMEEAKKLSKKFTMFISIEHLIRTIIMFLMVAKFN